VSPCSSPLSFDALVDWWTGDLPEADLDHVEEHLLGCPRCAAEAERVGAVVGALRDAIPTFVTRERVEALRARGLRIEENVFAPGVRQQVVFRPDLDLLIHRLGGLELADVVRVAVSAESESTGQRLVDLPEVPFDRAAGEVLVACQRHFRALPHDLLFRVRARDASGREQEAVYLVPHDFL
jgi:anti-sigma factor RsiW